MSYYRGRRGGRGGGEGKSGDREKNSEKSVFFEIHRIYWASAVVAIYLSSLKR